jgi:hypothetical protein
MCAGVAQLVEYKLPKLGVASSNLVARSSVSNFLLTPYHFLWEIVAMKVGYARFFLCPYIGHNVKRNNVV